MGPGRAGQHGRVARHPASPGGRAPERRDASAGGAQGVADARYRFLRRARRRRARSAGPGAGRSRRRAHARRPQRSRAEELVAGEIRVPRLAESISEAVLVQWLKQDGEQVAADEPIATLETDKAAVEIPADRAGVLRHARQVGDKVEVGDVIARVEEGAAPTIKTPVAPPKPPGPPAPSIPVNPVVAAPRAASAAPAAPPRAATAPPANGDEALSPA